MKNLFYQSIYNAKALKNLGNRKKPTFGSYIDSVQTSFILGQNLKLQALKLTFILAPQKCKKQVNSSNKL